MAGSAWLLLPSDLLLEVGAALSLHADPLIVLGPFGFKDPSIAVPDVAMYSTLSAKLIHYPKVGVESKFTTKWEFCVMFGSEY